MFLSHQIIEERIAVVCSGVRPFGVSLLIASWDNKRPYLFQVDPSGSYFAWKASAMGKNYVNAKTFLEKRYDALKHGFPTVRNMNETSANKPDKNDFSSGAPVQCYWLKDCATWTTI